MLKYRLNGDMNALYIILNLAEIFQVFIFFLSFCVKEFIIDKYKFIKSKILISIKYGIV